MISGNFRLQSRPLRVLRTQLPDSTRIWIRYPSNLTSWPQPEPAGGRGSSLQSCGATNAGILAILEACCLEGFAVVTGTFVGRVRSLEAHLRIGSEAILFFRINGFGFRPCARSDGGHGSVGGYRGILL